MSSLCIYWQKQIDIHNGRASTEKTMMETKKYFIGPNWFACLRRSSRVLEDMIVNTKQRTIEQEGEPQKGNNNTLHEIKNQSE